jgi:hypothetical protein
MLHVPDPLLRRTYRRRLLNLARRRPEPAVIFAYAVKCLFHYHQHTFARQMGSGTSRLVNTI